jgi:NADH dehydrogenase
VNVAGTRAVAEAARDAGCRRIVFLSGLGVARYGMNPRCTNAYFLSKLAAEVELFRSGLSVAVFRPSYVVGPGVGLIASLTRQLAAGEVERVGDGRYRLQPIGVRDAAAAILRAADGSVAGRRVLDLVGPEAVSFQDLLERVARLASGASSVTRIREIPVHEAERRAASGGYQGMLSDELDCLLCDEVGSASPLEALLDRPLTPLDDVLAAALRGA